MSQPEADNDALSEQYAETDSPTQIFGYGRPPKHAQFAKGRSGNPNGRPKGVRNFATVIEAELNTKIPINENGKRRLISKREAVAKQLVNKAASGDTKAIPLLLNESRAHERTDIGRNLDPGQSVADHQVMTGMLERIRRSMTQSVSSSAHSPADGQTPQGEPSDAGTNQPPIKRPP
jgi:hypothetical protein